MKHIYTNLFVLIFLSASVFGQKHLGATFDDIKASLNEGKKDYEVKTEYGVTYISERDWGGKHYKG